MSQDPNKFDPKETTEAKLCAYVDGELDAAGRAEIEKYLDTNPQHRKLIEELKETRQLMRALPRATAPAEIGEMLQGQLERSLLLNELDSEPAVDSMRISRAAQFRAVAAVILLALGLGAVVYFVLPSSNQRVAVVATLPADHELTRGSTQIVPEVADASRELAAREPVAIAGMPATAPAATPTPMAVAEADPFLGRDADREKVAGKAEDVFVRREAKMKGGAAGGGAAQISGKVAVAGAGPQIDPFRARVQQTIANVSQGQSPANFTCVVVSTPDPAATKQRVNTFLVSNRIQWQPVEEAMPQPIQFGQSQVAMTSRLNQTSVQLRRAGDQLEQPSTYFNNSKVASNGWPQSPGTQVLVNSIPATAPSAPILQKQQAATQSLENDAVAVNAPAPAEKQMPEQQQLSQQAEQAIAQPTTDEQPQMAQSAQLMDQTSAAAAGPSSEQYIVARNMTAEQTSELKALLAREGGPQSVEIFDASAQGDVPPTTPTLSIALEKDKPAATAESAAGQTQSVGRIQTEVRAGIAGQEASTTAPATGEVSALATAPATQLLALQKKLREQLTTQPAKEAYQLTLEPTTAPTQDVVIVLRNDASMTQAVNPAPSAAPPAPAEAASQPIEAAPDAPAAPTPAPATTQASP
jgi:hypothetical protein